MWVNEYLLEVHGEARGLEIIADIDHRYIFYYVFPRFMLRNSFISISAVPAFPGLRRFPDGRDFQQWTGDDSKALMKVSFTYHD
jgi:hypothetical protein